MIHDFPRVSQRFARWVGRWVFVALLTACALPNPITTATPTPGIPRGGELSVSLPMPVTAAQPWHLTDRAAEVLTTLTHAGLTRLDDHGVPQLELLDGYAVDPSGTVITATLKLDLLWSDGQPLQADDVAFTYNALRAIPVTTPLLHELTFIRDITTVGEHAIVFRLDAPYAPLVTLWTLPILPAHVLQAQPFETLNLVTLATSAGPFTYAERDADGAVHLRANPHYVRGKPYLDTVVLFHDADDAQRRDGFAKGNINVAERDSATPLAAVPGVTQAAVARNELTALVFNTRTGAFFADETLRRVLRTVADVPSLVAPPGWATTTVFPLPEHPFAVVPVATPVVTATTALTPTLLVQEALTTAGWEWDSEGAQYIRADTPLRLRLAVDAAKPEQLALATQIAERWAAVGVPTDVVALGREAYLNQFVPPYAFTASLVTWGNSRSDTRYADTLFYDGGQYALFARAAQNSGLPSLQPTTNLSGYSDAEYERAATAALALYDPAVRRSAEQTALARIAAGAPVVPLARPQYTVLRTTRIARADGKPLLDSPWWLWGVEQWYYLPE